MIDMSKKRKREEDAADSEPSKQQRGEVTGVDPELVEIYNRLADEKESRRLKAASKLLKKLEKASDNPHQINTTLRRLFRGLCSSRKAARQGFSIALTELLSQLGSGKIDTPLVSGFLVSIWEDSTSPEGGATKQEERDHFFGRVFGADAIIKSGILTSKLDREQWKRLLDLVCSVSQKKPWLRQECGWLLYQFVATNSDPNLQPFVEDIIDILSSHKIIRTPEGVAIWLAAKRSYPKASMSKYVWKHGHPFASKDLKTLADTMKDAKMKSSEDDSEAQGGATWSANLHFTWTIVLDYLFEVNVIGSKSERVTSTKPVEDVVPFEDFWRVVVDEGLLGLNSSPERKQWGVLVWNMALQRAPLILIPQLFTKNAMHCLITALGSKDSYRRKICENSLKAFEERIKDSSEEEDNPGLNASCVKAIIEATDYSDVDTLTKSKLITNLLATGNSSTRILTAQTLEKLFNMNFGSTPREKAVRQKYIIDLESKLLTSLIRDPGKGGLPSDEYQIALGPLLGWYALVYGSSDIETDVKNFVNGRLEGCLEQYLRAGANGRSILKSCVKLGIVQQIEEGNIKCDKSIRKAVNTAWRKVQSFDHDKSDDEEGATSIQESLLILGCVLIMEVAGGEGDAIEGLQELASMDISNNNVQQVDTMNALVELLLSLAPRPSKFLRSASQQIFESFSPQVTQNGLGSLTRVLLTKENAQGQREMMEVANDGDVDIEDLEQSEAEEEDLDSDVEIVDASDEESSNDSKSDSELESSSSDEDMDEDEEPAPDGERNEEEELAAFDAALASALGTRRLENGEEDPESSDSDSDMDDDQMMALDEKLTEVFKARKEASSKKKEQKDTKEAFIGFKNRVLDLVEVYLKHEYRNGLAIDLIVPLLQSIRITQTKQIAERTCSILRQFFTKCKGQDVPKIGRDQVEETLTLLKQVHEEAGLESSNIHSAVSSSASILLVKVLVTAGLDIGKMIAVYGHSRNRQLTDKTCKVQPAFFSDWNNWCSQARTQLAK